MCPSLLPMNHVNAVIERDKKVIAAVVRRFGPISRAGIHTLTHIRQSTTSKLVRELLDEGVLREEGRLDVPLGRKQSLLHLNEQHRFVAAIDLKTDRKAGQLLVQKWSWVGEGAKRGARKELKGRIEEELHRFERFQLQD